MTTGFAGSGLVWRRQQHGMSRSWESEAEGASRVTGVRKGSSLRLALHEPEGQHPPAHRRQRRTPEGGEGPWGMPTLTQSATAKGG